MIIMLGIFLGWLLFMFGLAWFGFQFNFLFGMISIVFVIFLVYPPIHHNYPMCKAIFKEAMRKAQEEKYKHK